ncbi:MAG TPA: SAM-dependent methyltransferase, partial [Pyrinomonadaceae bacterium]
MSGEGLREQESAVTSLAERLRVQIRRAGPMTFHDWMRAALYDPAEGYYQRRGHTRWGRAGDYRTAPETTPLFAATFARHFASLHEELHSPTQLTIVEAGAGAGHFARGVLTTLRRDHPKVFSSVRYVVDELSADSRARAAELLAPFAGRIEFRRIEECREPFEAGIIFSNELLDAFPVHRVVSRGGELRELCVGLDDRGRFSWVEGEASTPKLAAHFRAGSVTLSEGQIAEVNLDAELWVARAASVLRRGFVITVDYGAEATELYRAPGRASGTLRGY